MTNLLFLWMILSLFLGAFGAWSMSRFGHIFLSVDYPKERSSHSAPVPRGGGIGILVAFIGMSLWTRAPVFLWLPVSILSVFGFATDRKEGPALLRLLVQLSIACWIVGLGNLPDAGPWKIALSVFFVIYITGTANFYNFMDGINGIAGLSAITSFSLMILFAGQEGRQEFIIPLSLGLICACAGFLPLNIPKARVFMGDGGSLLLGGIFAVFVMAVSQNVLDFFTTAAFLFPFYADEAVTMFLRLRQGDDLTRPHRKHLYQILANEMGISHWKISVVYAFFQFIIGKSVLFWKPRGIAFVLGALILYFLMFIVLNGIVRNHVHAVAKRTRSPE